METDLRQHIVKDVTVAEYIVQCLVDCGVTHVFGGHGGWLCLMLTSVKCL